MTPEVTSIEKKKLKRSAKAKLEQAQNLEKSTVHTTPAPESAPPVNGVAKQPKYEWDRTQAEELKRKTPFPPPTSTTLTFPDFCEYYNRLRELPVSDYARIYVQRWWPVLLPIEKEDQFGNIKESFPSDVKVNFMNDGPMSEQLMLQLAGVGQYKFRLNDGRRPWAQQTVVFSEVEISDRSLWNLNRAVFDLDRLDLHHNRNQAYITFARSVGILPKEDEGEKEKAEMAQATVVETVMNDARQERARADQLQKEALERAEREAKESKEALARAQTATTKTEELKPATGPASDLLSVVTSVASLAKSLQPAKDDSLSEYLKLQQEREKTEREREKEDRQVSRDAAAAERKRADDLQAQLLADLKEAAGKALFPITTPPTPRTDVDVLEEMVKKQNLLKQLTGRGGSQQEEQEKASSIDKWLEAAPIIAPVISQFVGGIFQTIHFGLTTWQQISYNAALAKNGTEPKPPTTMEKPPEPGKPLPPQAPAPTPEQQAQQQQWNTIMAGVQMLAPHLIRFLDKGKSGAELAEFVIENADEQRTSYERIKHLADSLVMIGVTVPGANDLEKFMNAARFCFEKVPVLWGKVGNLPTMAQFLAEFFNYDEILAEAEKEETK